MCVRSDASGSVSGRPRRSVGVLSVRPLSCRSDRWLVGSLVDLNCEPVSLDAVIGREMSVVVVAK